MKTKIKFSLILLLLCLFAVPSYAQEQKTTMDILTSTVWGGEKERFHPVIKQRYYAYDKFDDKNMYTLLVYENGFRQERLHPYYLSNTPDEKFDKSKVGNAKNGKYIILGPEIIDNSTNGIITMYYELLEVTPEKIVMQPHATSEPITLPRSPIDPWKEKDKDK